MVDFDIRLKINENSLTTGVAQSDNNESFCTKSFRKLEDNLQMAPLLSKFITFTVGGTPLLLNMATAGG